MGGLVSQPSVVLGVSGSVAAYRAADLARDLMRAGFTVRVCLTDAAERFVSRELFEALTGQPCLQDVFEEPERGRMAHIDWARQASVVVVAPATANTLVKLGFGLGDDMLTTLVLASERPLVVAPAMNPTMFTNAHVVEALERLRKNGATVVEPAEGDVACGENGQGKLASVATIVQGTLTASIRSTLWTGKRILITSGPTYEPIDDVRFVGNRSSGKMGAALARAARMMGAEVSVVSGPVAVQYPAGARVVRVQTAQAMLDAALAELPGSGLVIGAAAVADYRPLEKQSGKMRRTHDRIDLTLVRNPDVLGTLVAEARNSGHNTRFIAFAAEPSDGLGIARQKRASKGVDAIVVNDVSRSDVGFGTDDNELTWIGPAGEATSGKRSKLECALWLLERAAELP